MSPRTDVHSPTNLVTEDYDFAYAYDAHPTQGDRGACVPFVNMLLAEGYSFGRVHGGDTCDHCGARLRYVAVLKHRPTMTLIKVGETCLDNRFDLATPEFHRLRKAAELNRAEQRIKNARLAWFAVDEDREVAFHWADAMVSEGDYGYNGMRHTFVSHIRRYGTVSDKFVRAICRDMARTERIAAERAIEAEKATPVVTGTVQITGEIISVKFQDNAYGGRLVMTVRDDRGFKVWGSVPSSISAERGQRVTFLASVEVSDRDETFGFFKRPRKAEVVA